MNINIIKVNDKKLAQKANDYLTKLIRDEKKYDKNINEQCEVTMLYDTFYENSNVCILLAQIDNQFVGYLYGYMIDIGDAYLNKKAKLEAMFVDEKYRNNKVGESLIKEFKLWASKHQAKYIELTVLNENKKAIKLYEKNGFKSQKMVMECDI